MTKWGYVGEDQREALGVDYKVEGNLEAKEGHSFPKEWGRLVNCYQSNFQGNIGASVRFVFEAEDGTIKMVEVDSNWTKFKIDNIKVLTIGRHSLT